MEFKRRLRTAGVTLVDPYRLILECNQCEEQWSLPARPGGRLLNGFWKCPNGCNSDDIPRIGYRPTERYDRGYIVRRRGRYYVVNATTRREETDNFPQGRKLEKAILALAKTKGGHSGFEWDDEREEWVPRDDKELIGKPNKGTQSGDKGDKPVKLTEVEKHGLFGRKK